MEKVSKCMPYPMEKVRPMCYYQEDVFKEAIVLPVSVSGEVN